MASQIILTQYDYGIELETQFVNEKKKPIDITGYSIKVDILYNDTVIDTIYAEHKDSVNGIVYFILTKEYSSEVGLYKTIWSVIDEDENITAQEDLYYYAKEFVGSGEEVVEATLSTDEIISKFNEVNTKLDEINKVNVNAELYTARGTFDNLGKRLDNSDTKITELDTQISQINTNVTGITTQINNLNQTISSNESITSLNTRATALETNKQNKTDSSLNTVNKTIPGAINELLADSLTGSYSASGYKTFKTSSGNFLIQWGSGIANSSGYEATTTVTFPKAMTTPFYPVVSLHDMNGQSVIATRNLTRTGFDVVIKAVAPASGSGVGVGAIRFNYIIFGME